MLRGVRVPKARSQRGKQTPGKGGREKPPSTDRSKKLSWGGRHALSGGPGPTGDRPATDGSRSDAPPRTLPWLEVGVVEIGQRGKREIVELHHQLRTAEPRGTRRGVGDVARPFNEKDSGSGAEGVERLEEGVQVVCEGKPPVAGRRPLLPVAHCAVVGDKGDARARRQPLAEPLDNLQPAYRLGPGRVL